MIREEDEEEKKEDNNDSLPSDVSEHNHIQVEGANTLLGHLNVDRCININPGMRVMNK